MSQEEALRRAAMAPVARLATTHRSGRVDLVPVTFAITGARLVTAVDHKPKTTVHLQRLDNVRAHPAVTVLVDHYEHDWDALWWVRITGDAVVAEPGEGAHAVAVAALVAKYRQYASRPPQGPAIVVEIGTVTSWLGRRPG